MLQLEELEERQERERGRLKGYIPIRRGLHAQSQSVPPPAIADSLRTLTAAQPCSQCSASLLPRAFSSVLVLLSRSLFSSADSKQVEQREILRNPDDGEDLAEAGDEDVKGVNDEKAEGEEKGDYESDDEDEEIPVGSRNPNADDE